MRTWLTILLLTAGTYALKAAGPVLLGGRRLPGLVDRVARLLPAALLAAAGVALWRRAGFLTTVAVAMAATAAVQALT